MDIGQPRMTPTGRSLQGVYKQTYCSFAVGSAEGSEALDRLIEEELSRLEETGEFIVELSQDGSVLLTINFHFRVHSGFGLRPGVLGRLAALQIGLGVGGYCGDGGDGSESQTDTQAMAT